jgi:hypothetical protein
MDLRRESRRPGWANAIESSRDLRVRAFNVRDLRDAVEITEETGGARKNADTARPVRKDEPSIA